MLLGNYLALHPSFRDADRGIVMTLEEHHSLMVLTTIQSLRAMGFALPIEIMYGSEEDLGQEYREILEEWPGVRDLRWALKPWAMLISSFQEVLFLNADVVFFADPEFLLHDGRYKNTGALFLTDRNLGRGDKRGWIKKVIPLSISSKMKTNRVWTKESGHMQDSGVVVVERWRHFVLMLLTSRLNGIDRDGNLETRKKGFYEMIYETFWLSWEMAGVLDYAFHDGSTGILGMLDRNTSNGDDTSVESDQEAQCYRLVHQKDHAPHRAQNYTSCSPQLVYFDTNRKALWLKGWITNTKSAGVDDLDISTFEAFLEEPRSGDPKDKEKIWQLRNGNVCGLTADSYAPITAEETQVLGRIIGFAQEYDWEP
ncbi:putative alpha-1,3-mannosyltransferase [Aureobasidium subglaciale]|nr:putative alpha-1,3-mannosyltransferase [Aureobasidium subglaciale]KAI5216876.1 putative alpha-1,3-mannosyltransferase [Aureobasidium subglaciale]KAI5220196.1 putative alpha-1,3-mannosyltransferase [Aureobasidium subglaciale]KAI5258153.1 putative alpha-1,3-mannosyltransferase [Aureobasidium subglaciale]